MVNYASIVLPIVAQEEGEAPTPGAGTEPTDTIPGLQAAEQKFGIRTIFSAIKKRLSALKDKLNKNAAVAAVLNAAFWGFGYFYNGKRRLFAIMLMASELIVLLWLVLNPTFKFWKVLSSPLIMAAGTLFMFALAFDAYMEAKAEAEAAEKAAAGI